MIETIFKNWSWKMNILIKIDDDLIKIDEDLIKFDGKIDQNLMKF